MEQKKNNAKEKVENIIREKKENGQNREDEQIKREMQNDRKEMSEIRQEISRASSINEEKFKEQEKTEKKQKSYKKSRGFSGLITAVITLGVTTLLLCGMVAYLLIVPTAEDVALETEYKRYFYDTVKEVDNIDTDLSKTLASKDSGAIGGYLLSVAVNSELAENSMQSLPLEDENKYYTTKLVNQIGDFAKYLNKKILMGGEISEEDKDVLQALYRANLTLKEYLQNSVTEMGDKFNFSNMGNGDVLTENFTKLQNLSVSYPELIYDGPFSDGRDDREIKGITGEEISKNRAEEIFSQIFGEYGLNSVEYDGETNSDIACYSIKADVKDSLLYAQISKKGGKLIMFAYAGSCGKTEKTKEYAVEKAQAFLENLGINNMQAVWVNLSNNVYTINFAYTVGDVIIYSDLIKVRVCAETGMVIGLEGISYYTNHTDRILQNAALTSEQAKDKVSLNVSVKSQRMVVIPIGNYSEKLCYEFMGEKDGSTYYVYIDAIDGKQVELFKVIDGENGELLV